MPISIGEPQMSYGRRIPRFLACSHLPYRQDDFGLPALNPAGCQIKSNTFNFFKIGRGGGITKYILYFALRAALRAFKIAPAILSTPSGLLIPFPV